MAHIQVPEGAPGILGPMAISPEALGLCANSRMSSYVARIR
jgi:hypothetical protein